MSGIEISDEDPMPAPDHPASPVTLEELHRCLVEELDITLDRPGRPATIDPSRASRDPERWAALATYGHPGLEPALTHVAGTESMEAADTGSLVLRELGARAVAYRADRTPPERVRRVVDLLELGPASTAGEAAERARVELEHDAAAIQSRVRALVASRRTQWEQRVRQQFRSLVRRVVRAEQVLRMRTDGEAPDPILTWHAIVYDQPSGWHHADLFRQHLGLDLVDIVPRGGPGADGRSDRELARVRPDTGRELVELIREYRSVMYPDTS